MKVGCIGSEAGELAFFKELVESYPAHDFYLYLDAVHGAYAGHTDDENDAALLRAYAWLEEKHVDAVFCWRASDALLERFSAMHDAKIGRLPETADLLRENTGGAGERVIFTTGELDSDELAHHLGGHFIPGS
jgi:hypothetical protein